MEAASPRFSTTAPPSFRPKRATHFLPSASERTSARGAEKSLFYPERFARWVDRSMATNRPVSNCHFPPIRTPSFPPRPNVRMGPVLITHPKKRLYLGRLITTLLKYVKVTIRARAVGQVYARKQRIRSGRNPCTMNTSKSASKQTTLSLFRMNTCEKPGRGEGSGSSPYLTAIIRISQ
jgi:hypothetical protein